MPALCGRGVITVTDILSDLINNHTELGVPIILNLREPVTIGSMRVADDYPVDKRVESYVAVLLRNRGIVGQSLEISKIMTADKNRVAFVVARKNDPN